MQQTADFESWWTANYFYTDGKHRALYSVFKELYRLGANFKEIDRLCLLLWVGDAYGSNRPKNKRKHVRTKVDDPPLPLSPDQRYHNALTTVAEIEKTLLEVAQSWAVFPFAPALLDFCVLPRLRFSCVGQKGDVWGSFFCSS